MGLDGPDYFDPMVVWSYYHMIMRSYDLNFPPDEYVIRGFHSSGSGRYVRPLPPELFVQELSWTLRGTMVLPWGEKGPFPNGSFPLAWWATLDFMSHRAAILAQGGFWCMAPISFPAHHPRAAPGRPREIIVAMLPNHTYRTYNIYDNECNVSLLTPTPSVKG